MVFLTLQVLFVCFFKYISEFLVNGSKQFDIFFSSQYFTVFILSMALKCSLQNLNICHAINRIKQVLTVSCHLTLMRCIKINKRQQGHFSLKDFPPFFFNSNFIVFTLFTKRNKLGGLQTFTLGCTLVKMKTTKRQFYNVYLKLQQEVCNV